jgi:hypothetical protein
MNRTFTLGATVPFSRIIFIAILFILNKQNIFAQSPYCAPLYNNRCSATDGFGVDISLFTLETNSTTILSDATGCTNTTTAALLELNYTLFSTTTPSVLKGQTYTFDIAFEQAGSASPNTATDAGYAIWIDWNDNNSFNDAEELVASGLTAGSGSFTIPTAASTGNHRMRVRARKDNLSGVKTAVLPTDACGTYDIGDTHDYTLNVNCSTPINMVLAATTNASCNSIADGTLTITATGGTGVLHYSIDNGLNYQLSNVFTALLPTVYPIKVKDENDCAPVTQNVTVGATTTVLVGTVATTLATCAVGGTVNITGTSGGTGSYTYRLSPSLSNTTGNFSNVAAGNYTLKVTDAVGCANTTSVSVTNAAAPILTIDAQTPVLCNGSATGAFTMTASGGTAPYTLLVKDDANNTITGTGTNPYTFSNLKAGFYTVLATDASNCDIIETINITQPAPLRFTTTTVSNQTVCNNTSVTLTPTGGISYKFYDSDPTVGGVTPLSTGTSYAFTATTTTIFWITKMVGSCESLPLQTTVTVEDKINPSVFCKSATIQLNDTGNATLSIAQIDNNSTDNCGITSSVLSKTAFNCTNLGSNTVVFTATDASSNSATCSAIVTIEDKINPSVFCKSATIQLNNTGNATLSIAQIDNNSTDNCGITSSVLSKTAFNCTNLGSNTVVFTATDASNNSATCSAIVTVEDKIAPTITCPQNLVVELGSGECQRVINFAATATDNCTASPIVVQLAGLQSGESFRIGTFNTGFKATDASNNSASCTLTITVKEHPSTGSMVCLTQIHVTIDPNCHTRILPSFMLNGDNYGCFENYSVQLLTLGGTVLPDDYISSNHIGSTLRAVITDNKSGNRCGGTLTVFDLTAPTIQAPLDIAVNCDLVNANGTPLSNVSGEPYIISECALPTSFYYTDNVINLNCSSFSLTPPSGFPTDLGYQPSLAQYAKRIVIRTFHVSDRYNNSTTSTRQVIYVRAIGLGTITVPSTLNLTCSSTRTEPTDTIINGVTIRGTGFPTFPNNRSITDSYCSINSNFKDIRTQNAANNTLTIQRTWTLSSGCFNEIRTLVQTITVRDNPPTITLHQNKVFQIPVTHIVTVNVNDLISSLSDDCTTNGKIIYGLRIVGTGTGFPTATSLNFNCNQIGAYTVEVWVKDEGRNIVTQTTTVSISADGSKCPTLSGMINREDMLPVPANVMLYNATNDSINSTIGASYVFKDLFLDSRLRVMPTRPNTDWVNGVTVFDVALMSRHILGIELLSTPYRLISADVNHSNDIDAVDMLLIRRLVLRAIPAIPNNNSWRFVLKNFTFNELTNPFASDFPESLFVPSLTNSIQNGDFVAIKIGDVNLSAGSVILRNGIKPFILSVDDKVLEKNKTYQIPIKIAPYQQEYVGNRISALQFALSIDKNAADIAHITNGDLPNCHEDNTAIFKKEGIVTAAWNSNQQFIETDSFIIFNLTIKPKENIRLSQILSINPTFTEGVAYDEAGNGARVKLDFGNTYKPAEQPILLANRPNPFTDETTISFVLPEEGAAKLTVNDLLGRVLMSTEKAFSKGLNEVVFSSKIHPSVSSGILIVRLQTAHGLLEQKIVLSR